MQALGTNVAKSESVWEDLFQSRSCYCDMEPSAFSEWNGEPSPWFGRSVGSAIGQNNDE